MVKKCSGIVGRNLKIVVFQKAKLTIQPKILEVPEGKSNGMEVPGMKFSKIMVCKIVPFSFAENVVPFHLSL